MKTYLCENSCIPRDIDSSLKNINLGKANVFFVGILAAFGTEIKRAGEKNQAPPSHVYNATA